MYHNPHLSYRVGQARQNEFLREAEERKTPLPRPKPGLPERLEVSLAIAGACFAMLIGLLLI